MTKLNAAAGTTWLDAGDIADHNIALILLGKETPRTRPGLYAHLVRTERQRRQDATNR